ncbi:rho guanine nucleotide exchange factor 11 isoform X3 [Syngnathus scovelli]|uniref:rho guanine nucleotide exchange factor 11 isoform X3 n=1 Tax=Syngnathus scovelli TaxID=161590 RepID=UPI0021106738|nr:rho guanine nucleotide exchange factor 11 isoform X3 [Syngnathus scovelli]
MSLRQPTSTLDSPFAAWLSSLTVGDSERKWSAAQQKDPLVDAPNDSAGAGLVQRCVVVQKDQLGFGFTVCGERVKLVQNVRAGGAAVKAGVQEGDRIIKVNGSLVSSMSHQEVVKLIKSGTYVALTLQGPPPSPSSIPAEPNLSGGETPPSPPSLSSTPSQRITRPKPLQDPEVQKHASQILRKMLQQEEMELQALMDERWRNPSPSLEERIESAKRRAHQVRVKLQQDASPMRTESVAQAVAGVQAGRLLADSSEGDTEAFESPHSSPSSSPWGLPQQRQRSDTYPLSDWSGRTQIIGPEEEDEDGYAFNEMDGPFQDVELLKSRPAHMTVFLRYVFTQLLDPNPLLFYLSVEAYLSAAPKDARSLALQICGHFLDPDAPLKLKVPVDYLTDIESRFHAQEDIRGPLSELQQQVLPHIQDQLLDYRNKQMMGLGALFGEADLLLLDGDPMKERQVVDKQVTALWEILCKHEEDRSSPLASAVLLYLRHAGVKLRDSKAFLGLGSEKEKWMAFLKAKKPGSAKKEKDGEEKKRNPLLKYIGKPRSTSQSTFHVPLSPTEGSVKNIIQHFENHTEDGGDPSSPSSGVDEDSPSGSKRLARSESLKAQGEGRRRGGASCGDSVPRSRSDVDMEDPAAEDREGTAFRLQHSASSASGSSARSVENATPPYTPRSIRRGTESPLSLLLLLDAAGGGGEEEACEGQNWQETVPHQLLDTLSPREVERQAVIYELFTTEASHLRTLRVLDQVFLQKMRSVLNADELACIFPNLPQVYELHASLCEAMRKRRESLIVQDIGDVMLARFEGAAGEEFEEQASRLCMQQSRALELIKSKQRKDPRFAHIVQECEASRHCRRLQLRDLLVAEMQRLTKYPLLLDNIIKHSEVTSADLPALRRAQACCRGILQAVNEVVRETQHRHHLSKYQRRLDVAPQFKGLDLSTKKMIHEGPLLWKVNKDKQLDIHALLLSDCLLLLQRGPDERLLLRHPSRWLGGGGGGGGGDSPLVNLDSLLVRSVATDNKALYVISTAERQIYELVAGTASEKNTWKDFLEKTIASAASPPVPNHGSAAETLGGASLVEAAGPTHTENAAKTLVDTDAISAARDQSGALHSDDGYAEGVAQAALQDVETLRQLLVLSAHADVWSHAFRSTSNECVHNLSEDQWEAAPCSSAQLRPKAAVADDATTASEQLSPSPAATHGNVFYLAMPAPAGESTTDPTDGGPEAGPQGGPEGGPQGDPSAEAGQSKASWQSHMIKNVDEVFRTIEDLTSKLRRLKDMEGEHRKLLTALRESRREEEDRGSADGKEANPAQPSIQSTGL